MSQSTARGGGTCPAERSGLASGLMMTGHEIGAALGVAALTAIAGNVATTAGLTFAHDHVAQSRVQTLTCDAHQPGSSGLQPAFPGDVVTAAPAPVRHTVTPPATTPVGRPLTCPLRRKSRRFPR